MAEHTSEGKEYGRMMLLEETSHYPDIMRKLKCSACMALPSCGTRYEIRLVDLKSNMTHFGRVVPLPASKPAWAMCWYAYPASFSRVAAWDRYEAPSFDAARSQWAPELGCYRVARLVTVGERESYNPLFALDEAASIPLLEEASVS